MIIGLAAFVLRALSIWKPGGGGEKSYLVQVCSLLGSIGLTLPSPRHGPMALIHSVFADPRVACRYW